MPADLTPISVPNTTPWGRRFNAGLSALRGGRSDVMSAGDEAFALALNLGFDPAKPLTLTEAICAAVGTTTGIDPKRVPDLLAAFAAAQQVGLLPLLARFTSPVG